MSVFKELPLSELLINPFDNLEKGTPLAIAGAPGDLNAMTISWGGMGRLWNKPVFSLYVRPSRHTYLFTQRESYFSICYFGDEYKKQMAYFGSVSGRDEDKTEKSGFTTAFDLAPYYEEAQMVLICRKVYTDMLKSECAVDNDLAQKNNPSGDYHRLYVGEIVKILKK